MTLEKERQRATLAERAAEEERRLLIEEKGSVEDEKKRILDDRRKMAANLEEERRLDGRKVAELNGTLVVVRRELEDLRGQVRNLQAEKESLLSHQRQGNEALQMAEDNKRKEAEKLLETQRAYRRLQGERDVLNLKLEEAQADDRIVPLKREFVKLSDEKSVLQEDLRQTQGALLAIKDSMQSEYDRMQVEMDMKLKEIAVAAAKRARKEWEKKATDEVTQIRNEFNTKTAASNEVMSQLRTKYHELDRVHRQRIMEYDYSLNEVREEVGRLRGIKEQQENELQAIRTQLRATLLTNKAISQYNDAMNMSNISTLQSQMGVLHAQAQDVIEFTRDASMLSVPNNGLGPRMNTSHHLHPGHRNQHPDISSGTTRSSMSFNGYPHDQFQGINYGSVNSTRSATGVFCALFFLSEFSFPYPSFQNKSEILV